MYALFRQKCSAYSRLMRLDKPIGTFLLLWPTLSALWIASHGLPSLKLLFIFCIGTLLMRSAGCVINDLADDQWDGRVARTNKRPLVTGEVTRKEALFIFIVLIVLAFALVLMTNALTIFLACIAVVIAIIYPLMKRITQLPQVVLSIAFAFGVPMAFAAQLNSIPFIAWVLFFAVSFWIMVYDTFYAMVDREDDIKAGIKSIAILLGKKDRWVIAIFQVCTLCLLISLGMLLNFEKIDYLGIWLAACLFVYQQLLIKNREPSACFRAFLNNHWVGLAFFLGFVIHY